LYTSEDLCGFYQSILEGKNQQKIANRLSKHRKKGYKVEGGANRWMNDDDDDNVED
jgi:hypothetical protein